MKLFLPFPIKVAATLRLAALAPAREEVAKQSRRALRKVFLSRSRQLNIMLIPLQTGQYWVCVVPHLLSFRFHSKSSRLNVCGDDEKGGEQNCAKGAQLQLIKRVWFKIEKSVPRQTLLPISSCTVAIFFADIISLSHTHTSGRKRTGKAAKVEMSGWQSFYNSLLRFALSISSILKAICPVLILINILTVANCSAGNTLVFILVSLQCWDVIFLLFLATSARTLPAESRRIAGFISSMLLSFSKCALACRVLICEHMVQN